MYFKGIIQSKILWNYCFALAIVVYATGLLVPIMQPDAAVYAEVSREMITKGNYFEIFKNGADWLDKPPFQFWITALSYKIFSVSAFAYKLPAILFTLLGVLYTFLFGKKFYSSLHGFIAALMLMTAQHIIISNNDVRAEPYLTGLTIMSLYFFALYLKNKLFRNIIFGSFFLACMIMTKGLFTAIPVVAGIGFSLLYFRKWKEIFNWHWLAAVVLVAIFISPALYGYYTQFDLHPEKEIFGKYHVSGIKFFLWDSQWGRFTNSGPIQGSGDPFYFFHTLLWAFAPWAPMAFFALVKKTGEIVAGYWLLVAGKELRTHHSPLTTHHSPLTTHYDLYTFFGFISLFIIFSFSRFQLSYYLNPLFPFLAIITAQVLLSFRKNKVFLKTFTILQGVSILVLITAISLLHFYFFDHIPSTDSILIITAGVVLSVLIFFGNGWMKKIVFAPAIILLSLNYYLNRDFYPALLQYQSESAAGNFIKQNNIPANELVTLDIEQSIMNFNLQKIIPQLNINDVNENTIKGKYVFTTDAGLQKLKEMNLPFEEIKSFDNFHITMLTADFIDRRTRSKVLEKMYLVKLNSKS